MSGAAAKIGNQYEDYWTYHEMFRLFDDSIDFIEFEPIDDSIGIEFKIQRSDKTIEFHSVKHRSKSHLAITDISSPNNARSILGDIFYKLERNSGSTFIFITDAKSDFLNRFTNLVKKYNNYEDFNLNLKTTDKTEFSNILSKYNIEPNTLFQFLQNINHKFLDMETMREKIEDRSSRYIKKSLSKKLEFDELFGVIYQIRQKYLSKKLSRENFLKELNERNYQLTNWNEREDIKGKIKSWNENFIRKNQESGKIDPPINRSESDLIINKINEINSGIITLLAPPGHGKSYILSEVLVKLKFSDIPYLAISLQQGEKEWDKLSSILEGEAPYTVLSGIANEDKCVFILDQLDSISQISGNYSDSFDRFSRILDQVTKHYDHIILIIGCRIFDFENDIKINNSINQITIEKYPIDIGLLPEQEVISNLSKFGLSRSLSIQELNLLRIPFFLRMFLDGDVIYKKKFKNAEELLGLYWDKKQEILRKKNPILDLDKCLESTLQSLFNNEKYIFSHDLIRERDCLEILKRESFLVEFGDHLSFLHPLLQDYAIARYCVNNKINLFRHLIQLPTDRKLFWGLKVRAILGILRNQDYITFNIQFHKLIKSNSVPVIVKLHLIDWFGSLQNPNQEDWHIINRWLKNKYWRIKNNHKPNISIFHKLKDRCLEVFAKIYMFGLIRYNFIKNSHIREELNRIPFNFDSWFLLANENHFWDLKYLNQFPDLLFGFLSRLRMNPTESKITIILPMLEKWKSDQSKRNAIMNFLEWAKIEKFLSLQEFLLSLLKDGFFDNLTDLRKLHSFQTGDLPEKFRIKFISEYIERNLEKVPVENIFSRGYSEQEPYLLNKFLLISSLENEFEYFIEKFYPILIQILEKSATDTYKCLIHDSIWHAHYIKSNFYDPEDMLLSRFFQALSYVSKHNPEKLKTIIDKSYLTLYHTLNYLLLTAFSENPQSFIEEIFEMIQNEPMRLFVSTSSPIGSYSGNYEVRPGRMILRNGWNHFSPTQKGTLFSIFKSFSNELKSRFEFYLLLKELPESDLDNELINLFKELNLKFKNRFKDESTTTITGGIVGSPIDEVEMDKMTDDQWINACIKYNREYQPDTDDNLNGGMHQFAQALGRYAQENPDRFVTLLLKWDKEIDHSYFGSVLLDISKEWKGKVEKEKMFNFIRKCHSLNGYPLIREISHFIERNAQEEIPKDILEIIKLYARIGKDPWKDPWKESEDNDSEDYLDRGINSDRGSIAYTIGSLIFHDKDRIPIFTESIEELSLGKSIYVRSNALLPVLYLLNNDREKAVDLFLKMISLNHELLKVRLSEDFLFYSSFTHFNQLRPLLLDMLNEKDKSKIAIASKQLLFQIIRNNEKDLRFDDLPIHINEVYDELSRMSMELIKNIEYRNDTIKFIYKLWKLKKQNSDIHLLFNFDDLDDSFFLEEIPFICDFIASAWFPASMNSFYRRLISLEFISEKIILSIGYYHFLSTIQNGIYSHHISSELMEIMIRAFKKSDSIQLKNRLLLFIDSYSLSNKYELLKRLEAV